MDFLQGVHERGSGFGSPSIFVYTLATAAPAEVALALGLRGSLAILTAGAVSGVSAVVTAARHVSQGRSRACITGGVELEGRNSAKSEGEIAALFLLEPSSDEAHWPSVSNGALGFDPGLSASDTDQTASPTATLLALARACAEPRGRTAVEFTSRSREGHWARFQVRW